MRRILLVALAVCAVLGVIAPGAGAFGVYGIKQNDSAGFNAISGDGGFVAFHTYATNLGPGDADALRDIYVRNTETGVTVLASRASGPNGAKGNDESLYPYMSANGRYVAFQSRANLDPADTDTRPDVYVRDLVAETTILVSRASGANGVDGNGDTSSGGMSADGRYVTFSTNSNNIDPADLDGSFMDAYVRDLQTNTTTLVSRATGSPGVKGDRGGNASSVSDDGRYAVFSSGSTNLDPADTDIAVPDVYVRDLHTNTTTLVSRVGTAGAKGNGYSTGFISGDGRTVAINSQSTNLHPDDTDTNFDVYVRDLSTNQMVLASRATGPAGAKNNAGAVMGTQSLSADGSRVVFETLAGNVSPSDADSVPDVYVRDLTTDTTYFASPTTTGANSNFAATVPAISAGGRYLSFLTGSTNMTPDDTDIKGDIYVRDLDGNATYLESRCCPGYARPKGATPMRVSLVPAMQPCASPNRTHGPPLAFGSCNPPQQESAHATVGTPDLNARPLKAAGLVRYEAVPGNAGTAADDADVRIDVHMVDVRDLGTLGDYAGELEARVALRLSDRSNGAAASETGTMQDQDVAVSVPCSATADTAIGATCSVNTTADAVLPGIVVEGARAIWQLGQVRLYDGGPDGDGDTAGGNTLFAVQGIFVP